MIEIHITKHGIERTDYDRKGTTQFHVSYKTIENIPDEVRTKLSALQLMADGDDLHDIGQKVSKTIYWIYETDPLSPAVELELVMSTAKSRKITLKNAWTIVLNHIRDVANKGEK